MWKDYSLEQARLWFSEEIRAIGHLTSDAVPEAFARVAREAFLGPGPWQVARSLDPKAPYRTTVDDDPRHIYHDVLVAIDPERRLNNGQPSALARWIEAADVVPGDRVLHIGCGVGFYTAIFAELVGEIGEVVGYEVDDGLAVRARAQLAAWRNATVIAGDAGAPDGSFDVVFVNAGCTHARAEWLAAMAPGGRLIIPMTVQTPNMHGIGAMFRIERPPSNEGEDEVTRWPARVISPVGMYDCSNARDPANEEELRKASGRNAGGIRAVELAPHARTEVCVAHIPGFCLQLLQASDRVDSRP